MPQCHRRSDFPLHLRAQQVVPELRLDVYGFPREIIQLLAHRHEQQQNSLHRERFPH